MKLRKYIKKADLSRHPVTSPEYNQIKKGHYLCLRGVPKVNSVWVSKVTEEYIAGWERRGNLVRMTPEMIKKSSGYKENPLQIVGYRKWDLMEMMQLIEGITVQTPTGEVKLKVK